MQSELSPTAQFTPVHPSLGTIVGGVLESESTSDKGDRLEEGIAAALWARYRLRAECGAYLPLTDLVASYPHRDHYVGIDVVW